MNNNFYRAIAVNTIILSIFGLFTLPFWAVVVQYIDSSVGFSGGQGYYTESNVYIFKRPLVYVFIIFGIYILVGITFLIVSKKRKKR